MVDAACRGMDPAIFHPLRGADVKRATNVCERCPVVEECRTYGEAVGSTNLGIWGGESALIRRRHRLQERLAASGAPTSCKTPGCPGSVAYPRRGLCHRCYEGERNARRRGEATHACAVCAREFLSLQALSTHLSTTHRLGRAEREAAVVIIDRKKEAS